MAVRDTQLNRLHEAAVVARRRYMATGFAGAATVFKAATLDELEVADAAQEASRAADEALEDYKSAKLWSALIG